MFIKICRGHDEIPEIPTLDSEDVFDCVGYSVNHLKEEIQLRTGQGSLLIGLKNSTTYIMNNDGETIDKIVFQTSEKELTQDDINEAEEVNINDIDFIGPMCDNSDGENDIIRSFYGKEMSNKALAFHKEKSVSDTIKEILNTISNMADEGKFRYDYRFKDNVGVFFTSSLYKTLEDDFEFHVVRISGEETGDQILGMKIMW